MLRTAQTSPVPECAHAVLRPKVCCALSFADQVPTVSDTDQAEGYCVGVAASEVWVRRRNGIEEIGRAQPQGAGYVVTWTGEQPVEVPRRPSGVRWAPDGSLAAQVFADGAAVGRQLTKSPTTSCDSFSGRRQSS